MKDALLAAEGIFRLLPTGTRRVSADVIQAIKTKCDTYADEQLFIADAISEALSANPNVQSRRQRSGTPTASLSDVVPDGDVVTAPGDPWTKTSANTLLKVAQLLMEKLLSDRFFSYICE